LLCNPELESRLGRAQNPPNPGRLKVSHDVG
jgi:hypothetical protein